ncbi:MAG: AsmA family protein [Prolixibacteraceae bacterium]|nr:AsmA family protein [Prolixibacteraceae bacterium]
MIKKISTVIAIIFAVLLLAAVIIPYAFKAPLQKKIKEVINENINAHVEFSDFNISFFQDFPKVMAELDGLTISGCDQFDEDTLIYAPSVSTDFSLNSLLFSKDYSINNIKIKDARVYLLVTQDGLTNWDIMAEDQDTVSIESSSDDSLGKKFLLKNLDIQNLNVIYEDESAKMIVSVLNTDLKASGVTNGVNTSFEMNGETKKFMLKYDSVQYISNTSVKVKSSFSFDSDKMKIVLGDSKLLINQLPLIFSGQISFPEDSTYCDVQFKQAESDFGTLLSVMPEVYKNYTEKVTVTGNAGFEGEVKGWITDCEYPSVNIHLFVKDGVFQYEKSSSKVSDISIDATIKKPQGDMDLMTFDIPNASAEIAKNPLQFSLSLSHLVSDPEFDAFFKGKIDFSTLNGLIPEEDIELAGIIDGNMTLKGRTSYIEQKQYDKIISLGLFNFDHLKIKMSDIAHPFEIVSGKMNIDKSKINLSSFSAVAGKSDFLLNGELSDYLPYFFLNKTLNGNFSLNSKKIDLDELSEWSTSSDTLAVTGQFSASEDSVFVFDVPDHLNFHLNSHISRMYIGGLEVINTNGIVNVKNQKLELSKFDMGLLGGNVSLTGYYKNNKENRPFFNMQMDAKSMQLSSLYMTSSVIRHYVPIAAKCQGEISSNIKMTGQFNPQFKMITSSLNGNGTISTKELKILDSSTFSDLKSVLKEDKLKNIQITDFKTQFVITNGNINITPFKTNLAGQELTVSGNISVDQQLDLILGFKVNRDDLSNQIKQVLNILPGSKNIRQFDIPVSVKGSIKKPNVSLSLGNARKQISNEFKKATGNEIKKSVEDIGKAFKDFFK